MIRLLWELRMRLLRLSRILRLCVGMMGSGWGSC